MRASTAVLYKLFFLHRCCAYGRKRLPGLGLFQIMFQAPNRKTPDVVESVMGNFGTVGTIPEGTVLNGRYEVGRVIGQGGMGVVYLAIDRQLDGAPRAIKTIRAELLSDPRGATQLKKEAMAALQLSHPNVVRVFHYEDWNGIAYIVMEYVEGITLAELIAERGKLAEEEFLRIAADMCRGLEYAHRQGVIHQDIKPTNIFIDAGGSAKLADFGIARAAKETTTRLTGVLPAGTLVYMSPEVLRGGKSSFVSDIYSLGITFYEMLAGDPPFFRGDIYRQHQEVAPEPIEGVGRNLGLAVLSALEKDPEARPLTAEELFARLTGAAEFGPVTFARKSVLEEEYENSAGIRLRLIPAGEFSMGSQAEDAFENETPAHNVKITTPFYIGIFPVTQEQYERLMGDNPSSPREPDCPVTMVTWQAAQEFCRRLSEMDGELHRLPTEAEWEFAARAGTRSLYYWGNEIDGRYAWYNENSGGRVRPVGKKEPNSWGLFDMLGNALEWCSDWYAEDYYLYSPLRDPKGSPTGKHRVLRGGSVLYYPRFIQSACRFMIWLENKAPYIGFRCVREIDGA